MDIAIFQAFTLQSHAIALYGDIVWLCAAYVRANALNARSSRFQRRFDVSDCLILLKCSFSPQFYLTYFCFYFIIALASESQTIGMVCVLNTPVPLYLRAERSEMTAESGLSWPLFYLSRRINVLCMASEAGSFLIFREYVLSCTVIGFLDIRFLPNSWKFTPVRFVRPYLVALFSTSARLVLTFFVKKCSTVLLISFCCISL